MCFFLVWFGWLVGSCVFTDVLRQSCGRDPAGSRNLLRKRVLYRPGGARKDVLCDFVQRG